MDRVESPGHMHADTMTAWLRLLHLADSALPIGGLSHSFGIESLVAEADLTEPQLREFFSEWLQGSGRTEAAFCSCAHSSLEEDSWQSLNWQLSAIMLPRESREASLSLGRRFLSLAGSLIESPLLRIRGEAHLATAFGRVGSLLGLPSEMVTAAFLHQVLFGAISACQRLLPLGQTRAMQLLWALKPEISCVVQDSKTLNLDELWNLQPALEIASMRHPQLSTRLFIS